MLSGRAGPVSRHARPTRRKPTRMSGNTRVTGGAWKNHLLKSSLPLEYDVSRIFAANEMSITADYPYIRADGSVDKECSVDVLGSWYGSKDIDFVLDVVAECKYRSPNKTMLFVEDPNIHYPPMTLGGTLNVFDFGSTFSIPTRRMTEFEQDFTFAYKGIEISNEGAHESELWRGVQQLRYSIPPILKRAFNHHILYTHDDDRYPIFFAKILITNSPLRVMNEDVDISKIEKSDTLDDISYPVDRLILYSEYGPEYENHFRRVFSQNAEVDLRLAIGLSEKLVQSGRPLTPHAYPSAIYEDLQEASRHLLHQLSTQFFIVHLSALDSFIKKLQSVCRIAFQERDLF